MNAARIDLSKNDWPRFADIPEPRMVGFFTGNGSGSKLYQGFLDGHPEMYMIPGYMLMYFYPHWEQWREELNEDWNWPSLIDAFCTNHASILDTRRIPGFDGLAELGKNQNEYIAIDEAEFRAYLTHLLEGEDITSRTFLLAVHYAYAKCLGQDTGRMKCVFFHIHVHKYIVQYLAPDFPEMQIIAMVRDPRSNLRGRFWSSSVAVDEARLNASDAAIYLPKTYNYVIWEQLNGLDVLEGIDDQDVRVVRHEDLYYAPRDVLQATARFLGISDDACFETVTFGGKPWWGNMVYGAQPMNAANPSIVADKWMETTSQLDWFVFEGIFYDYLRKFGYEIYKYKKDGFWQRFLLALALLLPSRIEMQIWAGMLKPSNLRAFLIASWREATGATALKDYSTNAYYRHKWTNKTLRLWRPRFYRELVKRANAKEPATTANNLFRGVAAIQYFIVCVARYLLAILSCPLLLIKRNGIYLDAYVRRLKGRNVLPAELR